MFRNQLLFLALLCPLLTLGQSDWTRFESYNAPTLQEFFDNSQIRVGNAATDFRALSQSTDKLGYQHARYQQTIGGVPVEGAQLIAHMQNGRVLKSNSRLVEGIEIESPTLTEQAAVEQALALVPASAYYWQDPQKELLIKQIKKDPDATFYPTPELVYASENFSQKGAEYQLAWKVDVFAEHPVDRQIVYIDAQNGEELFRLQGCVSSSVEGTAVTRYHGVQQMITDSLAPNLFVLRDSTRGGGVVTYDLNNADTVGGAVDFEDDDNYWDNANTEMNDAATDAHWGAEMTYDYFAQKHNHLSYNNENSPMISYIHRGTNWFNAQWTGFWAQFGDGNQNPLTSIDVVSHEFSHGVTGYSSGLIYRNESGALNESFSDIFGTAVEFFALQDSADWLVGRENFTLRSMQNPNAYGDPDCYLGDNFYIGPADNGGVHINSGVQNFWYYLMVNGGSGTNDLGNAYSVDALGFDTAEAIAFRNLTVYLTPSSTFYDARQGAIEAAADLYGECSHAVLQTAKAWHAVGVGVENITQDFQLLTVDSPMSDCNTGSAEKLAVSFRYNASGCGDVVATGENITLGYSINGGAAVEEDYTFASQVNAGDTFQFEFSDDLDFSVPGNYEIDFWVRYGDDEAFYNDSIKDYVVNRIPPLDSTVRITFEDFFNVEDSFYVNLQPRAAAFLTPIAAHTGIFGFRMTGSIVTPNEFEVPSSEADNFILNPEYVSEMCFCVEASDYNKVTLSFDLKQTYSRTYLQYIGEKRPEFFSSLRILADGQVASQQYHPVTNDSDLFITHFVNLDSFSNQTFDLCFQAQNFIRSEQDPTPNSPGDNAFIDNINVLFSEPVGVAGFSQSQNFRIYPNPNTGVFDVELATNADAPWRLLDLMGREVASGLLKAETVYHKLSLVSDVSVGTYFLSVQTPDGVVTEKLIVQRP